jgi:hypothetical protein
MRGAIAVLLAAAACGNGPDCAKPGEAGGQWFHAGGVLTLIESAGGELAGSDTDARFVSGAIRGADVELVNRDGSWTLRAAIDGCAMTGVVNGARKFEARKQ